MLIDYHVGASLIARAFGEYLRSLLGSLGMRVPAWTALIDVNNIVSISIVGPLLLIVLTAVLCRGAQHGAALNQLLTVVKVVVIVVVVALGAWNVRAENFQPVLPKGLGPVLRQSATVFFSFIGFDTIAASSEEVKNPQRCGSRPCST
jgi:APA family basic amino acid/polyamine antiporter